MKMRTFVCVCISISILIYFTIANEENVITTMSKKSARTIANEKNPFSIAIMGKTGVGKSTLINKLLNKQVAYVNDFDVGTHEVGKYESIYLDTKFYIYDTMGFFDVKGISDLYVKEIANEVKNVNVIIMCFDLLEPRWTQENENSINLMKNSFGKDIFQNVIFAFTKGNVLTDLKSFEVKSAEIRKLVNIFISWNSQTQNIQDLWKLIATQASQNNQIILDVLWKKINICDLTANLTQLIQDTYPIRLSKKIATDYDICENARISRNAGANAGAAGLFGVLIGTLLFGPLGAAIGAGAGAGTGMLTQTIINSAVTALSASAAGMISSPNRMKSPPVSEILGFETKNTINEILHIVELQENECMKKILPKNLEEFHDVYYYRDAEILFDGTLKIQDYKISFVKGAIYRHDGNNKVIFDGEFRDNIPDICYGI